MPEKDYTYGEQLLLEAVKSTYGIPTVALSALAVTGVFAGMRLLDWITGFNLPELPSAPTKADVTRVLDKYEIGITKTEEPRFLSDGLTCIGAHPVNIKVFGQTIKDPLRGTRILSCMIQKGWGSDVVANWIRQQAGA